MIILQGEACQKRSAKSPISADREFLDKTSVESLGNTFSIYILFLFLKKKTETLKPEAKQTREQGQQEGGQPQKHTQEKEENKRQKKT